MAGQKPQLRENLELQYPDEELVFAEGLDAAILGIDSKDYRVCYSVSECITCFVAQGMDQDEASEFFYHNTEGSYVGPKTPIFVEDGGLA